jgi:putative transposase
LVIGKNDGRKQGVTLGKRNNQALVFIPNARFITMLIYKAQLVGRAVVLTEESYTSKCRFLDGEPLAHQEQYAGKREKRGLIVTATRRRINADVHGAYNMIVKVVPNAFGNGREGVVVQPVRLPWRTAGWRRSTLDPATIMFSN